VNLQDARCDNKDTGQMFTSSFIIEYLNMADCGYFTC